MKSNSKLLFISIIALIFIAFSANLLIISLKIEDKSNMMLGLLVPGFILFIAACFVSIFEIGSKYFRKKEKYKYELEANKEILELKLQTNAIEKDEKIHELEKKINENDEFAKNIQKLESLTIEQKSEIEKEQEFSKKVKDEVRMIEKNKLINILKLALALEKSKDEKKIDELRKEISRVLVTDSFVENADKEEKEFYESVIQKLIEKLASTSS
jgi:hypothetical protein